MPSTFFRLQAMKREVHLRELQLLDAARRRHLHYQQSQREAELRRLDDEIERKVQYIFLHLVEHLWQLLNGFIAMSIRNLVFSYKGFASRCRN